MNAVYILVIVVILAALTMRAAGSEGFMETSYYYEAAPGVRGARMVCMPENQGQASLGIAVGRAAGYAAARVAKQACGPLMDFATVDQITRNTKRMATKAATASALRVVKRKTTPMPAMCRKYMPRPRPHTGTGGTGIKTSPGCPVGMIWDGARCRAPSAAATGGVQTSKGCPAGMIWDGAQCRPPSAAAVAAAAGGGVKTSKGCPTGMIWDGKKCRPPSAAAVAKARAGGAAGAAVVTSKGCPMGMIWDPKRKHCRVPSMPPKLAATVIDPTRLRASTTKPPGTKSPGCGAGRVWDAKTKKCRNKKNK